MILPKIQGPVRPERHLGVLHANNSNIICAQPSTKGIVGVENCLTLNIFTKKTTTLKPVIVWLNAEEYTTTDTQEFSFKRFVEEDVVFVSINFRLSIFGFLCLGIEEAPGNAGLRDVIQALKWTNSNIANFGGDPNNVVLMGHASGAAIVDLITMSSQAKGLVHKAVTLSGSGVAPWAVAYDPIGYAQLLGAKLKYSGNSKKDLAKLFMATEITLLNSALIEFSHFKNGTLLFAPCIENMNQNPNDTILADAPINILRSGNYLQIPYITGYTSMEGTIRASEAGNGDWLLAMTANFSQYCPVDLSLVNFTTYDLFSLSDFYFSDHWIEPNSPLDLFLRYEGDSLVVAPVIRGAQERNLTSKAEVRILEFGYVGTKNSSWLYDRIPLIGVRHGGILNYLFDFDLVPRDEEVITSLVKRFTIFAYTGSQTANKTKTVWPWLPISKNQTNYLRYTPKYGGGMYLEVAMDDPNAVAMLTWNDLYERFYNPPTPVQRKINSYSEDLINSTGKVNNILCVLFCSITFIVLNNLMMGLS